MSTVVSLAAAATKLSADELRELCAEIDLMEKSRRRKLYDVNRFMVGLTRLDDEDYRKLRLCSLAIKEDGFFQLRLLFPLWEERPQWSIAEIYFILKRLYGNTSIYYDNYKSSFSFPFTLDVIKGDTTFPYIFLVRDWKGTPEFCVRKIVASKKLADSSYHEPFEEEFSRQEINHWIAYFFGYLLGCVETFKKSGGQPEPFLRRTPAGCLFYGWRDGTFFERQYDNSAECEKAYHEYATAMQVDEEEEP